MENLLWLQMGLLLLLLAAALGWLLRNGRELGRARSEALSQAARLATAETALTLALREGESLRLELQSVQRQWSDLREQQARLESQRESERAAHQEKLLLLQEAREQMSLQFKQLASDILEQKGKSLGETSQQQLSQLLAPLGEKLQAFEKKVEDTYDKEAQQRFSLEKEVRNLQELNNRISADANRLSAALKGENKTQGTWGEVILERVLERSGLERGREYELQVSLRDDEGRRGQPDVVVHLPESKDVVIDSKVSLTAYEAYFSASDEDQRAEFLRQHITSIRSHIRNLTGKNYQGLAGLRTLDYVLLFLPVEAAFTVAIQHDEGLFSEAFQHNIILVGPSTLLATLRTIHNIWRYEYQSKNAREIAEQAGKLYDKFAALLQDLDKVGDRLGQAQDEWATARSKVYGGRGSLLTRVEKLKRLGARTSKQLPDTDDDEDALPTGDSSA
ncbi:MAG: DNA recombination protein RmuC [Pseudohongiellaceae bacterium]